MTNVHHFPAASNGKLLDVAVITEEKPQSPESPKVTLHQWVCLLESDSDIEVEDLPPVATPHKGELRKGDWGLPILSGQVRKVSFASSVHLNMRTHLIHYKMKYFGYSVPYAML